MKHIIKIFLGLALAVVGAQAHSIALSPSTPAEWTGSDPKNPDANDIETIVSTDTELLELYKADVADFDDDGNVIKPQSESGAFASSYDTVFSQTVEDPSNALISYIGGDKINCGECYLLVKDGNQDPIWYVFNLTDGWDGMEDIVLTGFWPNQGAISHVSIFGTFDNVPAPVILGVMGIGLMGMVFSAGLRRRKIS